MSFISRNYSNHLIEKEASLIQQNFVLVMNTVFNLRHYMTSFCINPLSIFCSNDFLSLDRDILFSLLKSDNLRIEEIIIWDGLIKWGINQTPELKNIQ